jgi:PBSX family phage terminase large subunit
MDFKVSNVYKRTESIYKSGKYRQIVSYGGSRSGKSYSILQLFCILLMQKRNFKITVWRNEKVTCRATVLEDFRNIIYSDVHIYNQFVENKAQASFTCKKTGSRIIFEGADSIGKVLGMTQHISFFNEITEFNEDVYNQITQRTKEHVFVDYNPSKKFWLDRYRTHSNTIFIQSTFRDNPFLEQGIIDKLLSYDPSVKENVENGTADEYMWKVYGLGELAEKPNRVYKGWGTISRQAWNEELTEYISYYGLDFGLSNPTALVEVKYDGDRTFYVRQRVYKSSQSMQMPIAEYIKQQCPDIGTEDLIVCDSAKMSMVVDMQSAGFMAVPALKGPGSVDRGINVVQAVNVVYSEDSRDLDDEYVVYSYVVDRYGLATDQVVRKDDHLLDALRYIISYLINYLDIKI